MELGYGLGVGVGGAIAAFSADLPWRRVRVRVRVEGAATDQSGSGVLRGLPPLLLLAHCL